ncbi:MAG: adenylosuccinate lyase [Rhodobacteraceae bacterium]|nr:adenylosuccinate lyase [Paracoccaceae bacterium]
MTTRTVMAALAVIAGLLPAAAFAQCDRMEKQAALTCAEGTVWDAETQRCVVVGS